MIFSRLKAIPSTIMVRLIDFGLYGLVDFVWLMGSLHKLVSRAQEW